MAQTPPPTLTPTPTPAIQRGDRTTFSGRVDAFITWLSTAVGQFAAATTNVYNNAVDAFNSATSASASASTASSAATTALTAAGAVRWVSGTTYAQDALVISPLNGATYRRRTAGDGTTDPASDPANWAPPILNGFTNMVVITSTQSWTPPQGVTKAKITLVDGGGAGLSVENTNGVLYGDGGVGGNAGVSILAVSPLVTYLVSIGAGGAVKPASQNPNPGAPSSFSGTGITTLTTANAALKVPGGKGGPGIQTVSNTRDGGASFLSNVGTLGYGAGGEGGDNGLASPGRPGVVVIEY